MAHAELGSALVTGGGRRIGRAIAFALAKFGYGVVVHANTSRAPAEEVCEEIIKRGGRASVVLADLAQHEDVLKLVPAAAALGPLTLLVNNASEFEHDEMGALDRSRFDRAFAINLRAPLFLAEAFAQQVPDGTPASIVNILDQRVLKPTPRFISYSLSKSALFTATTMLAQSFAPKLRVNAVAPGPVLPSPRQSESDFAAQAATLPLGHGPSPEEIAQAVVFLAGAGSVTGQTISVDGGQHLAWRTPDAEVAE
jgi:NAD(P)-dependent dehydrogenase (short-subunit alcohol dehydrogenase family)